MIEMLEVSLRPAQLPLSCRQKKPLPDPGNGSKKENLDWEFLLHPFPYAGIIQIRYEGYALSPET
jgi:hypothetical protein